MYLDLQYVHHFLLAFKSTSIIQHYYDIIMQYFFPKTMTLSQEIHRILSSFEPDSAYGGIAIRRGYRLLRVLPNLKKFLYGMGRVRIFTTPDVTFLAYYQNRKLKFIIIHSHFYLPITKFSLCNIMHRRIPIVEIGPLYDYNI